MPAPRPSSRSAVHRRLAPATLLLLASPWLQAQQVSNTSAGTTDAEAGQPSSAKAAKTLTPVKASADQTTASQTRVGSPSADNVEGEPVVELSPFVVTEQSKGYQATNTMSGSRLNTKLEDVAASITVVTKDQLNDFAAVDINDIFAMEVGVEGTRSYTANNSNPTALAEVDEVSQNPTTANRVRGLGNANVAIGNFSASSTIPIDTYNIDAVEISRGPNSSIFGTGEVSGGVNLIPSSANLQKSSTRTSVQVTSYGTLRNTFDINRPLFRNLLALRISTSVTNQTYTRKPSYDKTRRSTFALTFRPHKDTTLRASWESFSEKYSRPNSVLPRNDMAVWNALGQPSWNPVTNTWSQYKNGTLTTGTLASLSTSDSSTAGNPYLGVVDVTSLGSSRVRPTMFIDDGQVSWFGPTRWFLGSGNANVRELTTLYLATNYGVPAQYQNGLAYTGIVATPDRSFYDYKNINLSALNYGWKSANIGRVELEHFILNNQRHTLAVQLGLYKESVEDIRRTFVGSGRDGVPLEVLPDVNRYLPDGSVNTHYGAPYITALAPQTYSTPSDTLTQKLNLVYQFDFSQDSNRWLRALGRQRFLGYIEYSDKVYSKNSLRYRDQIVSTFTDRYVRTSSSTTPYSAWISPGGLYGNNNTIWNARYYVGDGDGGNIDHATTAVPGKSLTYTRWGNNTGSGNASWNQDTVSLDTTYYANGVNETVLRTKGFVWQGAFLQDRIVPTWGLREDAQRTRSGGTLDATIPGSARDSNGLYTNLGGLWNFSNSTWDIYHPENGGTLNKGSTHTAGIVVKPFTWLSLRYNQSNSMKPTDYTIDFQGNPYANPHGETTDYGFALNLFRNKLSIGLTKYSTKSLGSLSNSTINTYAMRLMYLDFDRSATSNSVGYDLQDWYSAELLTLYPTMSDAELTSMANRAIGLTDSFIDRARSYTEAISTDEYSRGYELELNYNPSRYWTLKVNGSKGQAITDHIGQSWTIYRDTRMPIWQNIVGPSTGSKWWTTNFSGTTPKDQYYSTILPTMLLYTTLQGQTKPQTHKYKANVITNYRLAGISGNRYLRNVSVGTAIRWEDRAIVAYHGAVADADGIVRTFDVTNPIYDKPHTYVDLTAGYDLKLFKDRVKSRIQLNVRNAFEGGRLQCYSYNPDGSPINYRIVDPREFVLTWSFDL